MSQLRLHDVVLEEGAINVIVRWVAVYPFIEEKSVKRKAPVARRLVICVLEKMTRQ